MKFADNSIFIKIVFVERFYHDYFPATLET